MNFILFSAIGVVLGFYIGHKLASESKPKELTVDSLRIGSVFSDEQGVKWLKVSPNKIVQLLNMAQEPTDNVLH